MQTAKYHTELVRHTTSQAKTNAYNVTTHANGQVSYGARPTQNKPSETNAYNVTTHANGQHHTELVNTKQAK